MALTNRYRRVIKGNITAIGNALVIGPTPGATARTGAFISTNTSNQVSGYPVGTVATGSNASSSAVLNIPSESTVVFAQLFWNVGSPSNSSAAITFTTPLRTISVTPTTVDNTVVGWPVMIADVTSTINTDGSGTYTLGNIPVVTNPNGTNNITANWSLIVVYTNLSLSYKYIAVNTGSVLNSSSSSIASTFSGFSTPASGTNTGYFIETASNGYLSSTAKLFIGAVTANTQIGNSSATWNNISPYCITNNILTGTILVADTNSSNLGFLDTSGTFGTYNVNPFANTFPAFGRTSYDLIAINISNNLVNSQNQLVTNSTTGASGSIILHSQSLQIGVSSADLGQTLSLTVDKATANIGDVLMYTIAFKNTGSVSASNVILMDTTPTGTVFLTNTLYVDGVQKLNIGNINPSTPLRFGTITANESHTVTFNVVVTTIPSTFKITNIASLNYGFSMGTIPVSDTINTSTASTTINYISIPLINSAMITATYTQYPTITNGQKILTDSNYVLTQVNTATIVTSKSCNTEFAQIGDVLTYTIPFKNTGNVAATNVILIDTLPNATTLLGGTFKVDGVAVNTVYTSPSGYNLGTIGAGEAHTIAYSVLVSTTPTIIGLKNSSTLQWNFTVDPSIPNGYSFSSNSNITTTTINYPFINTTKYVDKQYATWNDILTYTIRVQNSGTTIANNVVYQDTVPSGTTYVSNTLTINGISSSNPLTSIKIGNLDINSVSTIIYKVKIN